MANVVDDASLKLMLHRYQNPDVTRKEICNALKTYRSLYYRLEGFIFNNGTRKDLINLDGTIPVNYKGAVYNIPVCIWLMDTHPAHAPLCFVKPTQDMAIKMSRYVDSSGKVYLPYLHQWNSKSSSLIGLIQKMIAAFGELCPVYTKPRCESNQPPYPVSNYPSQMPGQPPYPVGGNSMPYPTGSYPSGGAPQPFFLPVLPSEMSYRPPDPFYPTPPQQGVPDYNMFKQQPPGTITNEHIKASLISAIEDKLRRKFDEERMQSEAEMETLKRTQTELEEGRKKLEEISSKLKREKDIINDAIVTMEKKDIELDEAMKSLESSECVDPDEAVTTTAPLYAQLLDAFAKEATYEDAIYYIGEALRKGKIDLDTFLKQVRAISRQQFTMRQLMQKCRQKAGLAC